MFLILLPLNTKTTHQIFVNTRDMNRNRSILFAKFSGPNIILISIRAISSCGLQYMTFPLVDELVIA